LARRRPFGATGKIIEATGTMDYERALTRIYEHIENDEIEKALMGCLRIARTTKIYLNAAIFTRELNPNGHEVGRVLFNDSSHLKAEEQKFILETSLKRWLEIHKLDFNFGGKEEDGDEDDKPNVLRVSIGEIEPELEQWERSIADMALPAGMAPFDIAVFTDQFIHQKAEIRLRMKALQTIKARLKTLCLNYAIQIERQLAMQRQSQGFLEAVQNEVNNFFKARAENVFDMLQKAAQLSISTDPENASLVLTEVRRALKAAADYFYPPASDERVCSDGVLRLLGEEQYLNRLYEFLSVEFERSTARDLLKAELAYLLTFIRRLNEIASKGVHGFATLSEAKQGLVGLYFFLFNVCTHVSSKSGRNLPPDCALKTGMDEKGQEHA
jgi:hypothetical protein